MKILYVDMQYDYGKKERGQNQIGEIGFRRVFETLGHNVVSFYYDQYLADTDPLQEKLLSFADFQKPDLIFFCLYTDQFYPETLRVLTSKYRTMNWFGDDQWRFDSFTSKYGPLFTYCVTTDPYAIKKYDSLGVKNVMLSQWAALNVPLSCDENPAYRYDISFVGAANPIRKWMISEFHNAGLKVATFGHGWPSGPVSIEKMIEVFGISKVNLNLSNSVSLDVRYLIHHWKNIPYAFYSKKNFSQIKARNFEIPYYGGFQLTDYVPSLEQYFEIGNEIGCYANIDEAIQQGRYYLENSEIREKMRIKGMERARKEHTYLHRFKKIFESI